MSEIKTGPQLSDFELALSQVTAHLYIMYSHNGNPDEAASKVVIRLLAEVSKLTPYLEDILSALKDESFDRLARPLELAIAIAKEKNVK